MSITLGKYIIYGNNYRSLSFLIKEKFVDEEYYFTTKSPSPAIIDCGANIGMSVLYFKSLYPNASIYCFEPHPDAFQLLQQNVIENNLKNVFLHETALSDVDGTVSLYSSTNDELLNSSIVINSKSRGETQVASVRLSKFLENFEQVDLIKIDVEGAEIGIIADLINSAVLSAGRVKQFIIEYHYSKEKDPSALSEFIHSFEKNGYSVTSKVLFPGNAESDLMINASLR